MLSKTISFFKLIFNFIEEKNFYVGCFKHPPPYHLKVGVSKLYLTRRVAKIAKKKYQILILFVNFAALREIKVDDLRQARKKGVLCAMPLS